VREERNGENQGFHPRVKLPQLKLPIFSGDPLEWPAFWQSFESAVGGQNLQPVDKLEEALLNMLFSDCDKLRQFLVAYKHFVQSAEKHYATELYIKECDKYIKIFEVKSEFLKYTVCYKSHKGIYFY
jgi:hypothetical protein